MATATVPAAVPDPNDPANTSPSAAPSGLLASMLAPVEPARPTTFDLTPTTGEGATDAPVTGASSAVYHGSDEANSTGPKSSTTADKKGIWRAWLLAGAARWAKGGGAHNKRLDMLKAKVAAHQVKEARQISVNRSGGLLPGKGSAGSAANGNSGGGKGSSGGGKGSSGTSGKGPAKGPAKSEGHSNGNAHKGSGGRSGGDAGVGGRSGGGRGPAGSGAAGGNGSASRGGGATPKGPKTDGGKEGHGPKPSKTDLTKDRVKGKDRSHGGRDAGASGGKNGATGPAGATGKSGTTTNGGSTKGTGPADAGKDSKTPSPKASRDKTGTDKASTKNSKAGKVDLRKNAGAKPGNPAPARPDTTTKPDKTTKDKAKTDDDGNASKDAKPQAATTPGKKTDGKPFSTKESRETGYRDGTRAAKIVAHAKAYRDGAKDGWTDTTEAAERQKAHLDKAHQERNKAQDAAREKEQDVSGAGSSADHHKPQPIEVKGIDADTVWLGEGADRNSLSRGEVRSLKHFERRLETKVTSMKKAAEGTKLLKAHAEAQSQKATALMEATKSVKGGEKLIASLVKTADDAKVQADLAEETHKRAVRAADGCAAVLANAQTRYGAMYKAVVDSDEEVPGEMDFYKDGATTHG
ncbi:hypothetical protein [Streptomyces sp. NPDC048516]|uniref:hypothetical protein n=1 Tax=Streptomyces sp. NPDC048516 TaxID=3365565 RepID=UPI0037211222